MAIVDLDKEVGIDIVVKGGVGFEIINNRAVFFIFWIRIIIRVITYI